MRFSLALLAWLDWTGSPSEANEFMLQPLFGKDATTAIIACKGDYSGVQNLVTALATESELGASLFRSSAISVSLVEFEKELATVIAACIKEPFTEAHLGACMTKLQALVDSYLERGLPQISREIVLPYLRFEITVVVKDFAYEAQMRLWAAIKNHIIGRPGGLPAMVHEQWFLPEVAAPVVVDKAILEGPKLARQMVHDMMENEAAQSINQVREMISGASSNLVSCDPWFIIELAFVEGGMVESLSTHLQAKILSAMPSPTSQRSLQLSIRALETLQGSVLCKWAPVAVKAILEVCMDVLKRLAMNKSPPAHLADSTTFYRDFWGRLQYFLHEEVSASASEAPKHLHGRDALLIRFANLEEKHGKGAAKLEEVEEVLAWSYLLKEAEIAKLTTMVKDLVSAGARGQRPEAKRARKDKKEDDDIDQFFA